MSLPLPTVDLIFDKFILVWGHRFLSIWDGLDLDAVKHDWAHELRGLPEAAITYGLMHLPTTGRPPDVFEFRAICARRPQPPQAPQLPAPPRAVPDRFKTAIAQLAVPLEDQRPAHVQHAYRFINKWGTPGVRLTPMQQEWLAHYRAIAKRWEAGLAAEEKARESADAQQ